MATEWRIDHVLDITGEKDASELAATLNLLYVYDSKEEHF